MPHNRISPQPSPIRRSHSEPNLPGHLAERTASPTVRGQATAMARPVPETFAFFAENGSAGAAHGSNPAVEFRPSAEDRARSVAADGRAGTEKIRWARRLGGDLGSVAGFALGAVFTLGAGGSDGAHFALGASRAVREMGKDGVENLAKKFVPRGADSQLGK